MNKGSGHAMYLKLKDGGDGAILAVYVGAFSNALFVGLNDVASGMVRFALSSQPILKISICRGGREHCASERNQQPRLGTKLLLISSHQT